MELPAALVEPGVADRAGSMGPFEVLLAVRAAGHRGQGVAHGPALGSREVDRLE